MLQLSEFVWTLRSSIKEVFNQFLLIDVTDRGKISKDLNRLFFANTPFKEKFIENRCESWMSNLLTSGRLEEV